MSDKMMLKEGRKILWKHTVIKTPCIMPGPWSEGGIVNPVLQEFILRNGDNYRFFVNGVLEAIFKPTAGSMHLAILANSVSYYRVKEKI